MKKVFISSVMKDFSAERLAGRTAVESLSLRPVMAEDFGAKPYSSQTACLQGVRESEVYVGILAHRYGFVGKSGLSAVEEEFQEARKSGKDVLIFVQKGDLDADQRAFFQRIGDYEAGYFVDFFQTPHQLQTKITKALYDLVGQPDVKAIDAASAAEHVRRHVQFQRDSGGWPIVGAVILPIRQGLTYFEPLDMGKPEVQKLLLQRALFAEGALFSTALGSKTVEGREHLRFEQGDNHHQLATVVEAHADGTLVWTSVLSREREEWFHSHFFIDQDEVQRRLAAFLAYARDFYGGLDVSPPPSSFYVSVVLKNIQQKYFGPFPKPEARSGSIAVPMDTLEDPLWVPNSPMKLSRADMSEAVNVAMKLVGLIGRVFKASGREHKSSGRW